MPRGVASRTVLLVVALALVLATVGGAFAAGPRDKDKNDGGNGGNGGDEPKVTQDLDGDLMPDVSDNCLDVYNPDQGDDDGNGVGNACQPPADADHDGIRDERDNCPNRDNGHQNDSDRDGIGDACDNRDDNAPPPEETAAADAGGEGAAAGEEGVRRRDRVDDAQAAPHRAPQGPPPVLKPFVLPPETFATIAKIDAGAEPPPDELATAAEPDLATLPTVEEVAAEEVAADGLTGEGTSSFHLTDPAEPPVETEPAAVDADLPVPVVADAVLAPDPVLAPDAEVPAAVAAGRAPAQEPWGLDAYFAGGLARTRPEVGAIAGTDDDALYLTQRRGDARGKPGEFRYAIPVPEAGTYRVRLHFAEIYWGAPGGAPGGDTGPEGQRVFSVEAEGTPKLVDYDIVADVGPATAVVKQFAVPVTDGELDLRFAATRDQPMVAAIEVLGEPIGERWVDVNKKTRTVRLMVGGTAVATSPC